MPFHVGCPYIFMVLTSTKTLSAVLTLSACTPPLPEVLKLWDFLIAFGAHLNILCVVAQLLLMREELLSAQRYPLRTHTVNCQLTAAQSYEAPSTVSSTGIKEHHQCCRQPSTTDTGQCL